MHYGDRLICSYLDEYCIPTYLLTYLPIYALYALFALYALYLAIYLSTCLSI